MVLFFSATKAETETLKGGIMQTRQKRADEIRANCDKGLGPDCACANMLEAGHIDDDEDADLFILNAERLNSNRHIIVIDDLGGLLELLSFEFIFGMSEGEYGLSGQLDLDQIDPFANIDDAIVVEDTHPNFSGETMLHGMKIHSTHIPGDLILSVHRPKPLPGKGEGALIRGYEGGRSGKGNRARGGGGFHRAKGGN